MDKQLIFGPFHRDLFLDVFVYVLDVEGPVFVGQGDSFALGPGPGGTADAVNIVFRVLGQVIVDYMGDPIDVQTPGATSVAIMMGSLPFLKSSRIRIRFRCSTSPEMTRAGNSLALRRS